ncbi:MAG: DUF5103 domain-containing protein [Paludibacteraceae bacterium]|nr:DUF5103 domain-containing protein [Paludibacteraceae bacterium]
MKYYLTLILFFTLGICSTALASDDSFGVHTTAIYNPDIYTLRVRYLSEVDNNSLPTRPFLILNNEELDGSDPANTLEISWDEMSHDARLYSYTVCHLNHDGKYSDLQSSEYINGFTTGDVIDYTTSMNTQRDYTHYSIVFPNEDMRLCQSGLYVMRVYEDGDIDHSVLEVCFAVLEPLADIDVNVSSTTTREIAGRFQQVNIDVNTNDVPARNANDIFLVVTQNNREDNKITSPRPSYIEPNKYRWINHPELTFEGGNEYRHFDIFSTYYAGTNIDRIRYEMGDYQAYLYTDQIDTHHYIHNFDVDGQRVINAERTSDPDIESEYMWVHFILPMQDPLFTGSLYVGGDLFLNSYSPANRMRYDNEHHCYYLNTLVKQGGTDYMYFFIPKGDTKATLQYTEGSHWQTQNTYTIYVFYRPFGSRADRLVGMKTYSSSSM